MLEQVYGFLDILARSAPRARRAPEKVIQRVGSVSRAGSFRTDQLPTECVGDAARDLVLQREQIADIVVETLCPKMRVGCGVDQLGVDPDLVARTPDAAFEHIAHPKLAADLLGVHLLAFVREGSAARDHQNIPQPRQIGCQIVGDPVREILLFGILAEICEGQDDDRQPGRRLRLDASGRWACRRKRLGRYRRRI